MMFSQSAAIPPHGQLYKVYAIICRAGGGRASDRGKDDEGRRGAGEERTVAFRFETPAKLNYPFLDCYVHVGYVEA
jgi:hypothetical protein